MKLHPGSTQNTRAAFKYLIKNAVFSCLRCGRGAAAYSLPGGGPEVRTLPPTTEVPELPGRHPDHH